MTPTRRYTTRKTFETALKAKSAALDVSPRTYAGVLKDVFAGTTDENVEYVRSERATWLRTREMIRRSEISGSQNYRSAAAQR